VPNPLDCLGNTDIVGLELVKTNTNYKRSQIQAPHQELPHVWHAVVWDIVDNDGSEALVRKIWSSAIAQHLLESDVRVNENAGGEDRVHDRVQGTSDEGRN